MRELHESPFAEWVRRRTRGQSQHHGRKRIPEWVLVAGFTSSYGFSIKPRNGAYPAALWPVYVPSGEPCRKDRPLAPLDTLSPPLAEV